MLRPMPRVPHAPHPGPRADRDGPAATVAPVRVLYIAGSGRSGSTLVERILGQLEGFFSAGEMRFLWQRGVLDNRLCGCGVPFAQCPTWQNILEHALPDRAGLDVAALAASQRSRVRMTRVPALVVSTALRRRPARSVEDPLLSQVYRSAVEQTCSRVLVDSSKLPTYGHLVSALPGVELFVLHVVRDPRATAFSWKRSRALHDFGDERLMQQQATWKSTLLWLVWNTVTELLWRRRDGRYLRVRYEDLVRAPERAIERAATLVDRRPDRSPFLSSSELTLAPTHSVAGNPSRHRSGHVSLTADTEWGRAMPLRDRLLVTVLTWPWLLHYGYPLWARRAVA